MKYRFQAESHELWAASVQHSAPLELSLCGVPPGMVERAMVVSNREAKAFPAVILPDVCAHLVIHYYTDGRLRASLIGPRSQSRLIDRQHRTTTYILRLQPTALPLLTGFPASELLDRSISLHSLIDAATADYLNPETECPPHELLTRSLTALYGTRDRGPYPAVGKFIQLARAGQLPITVSELARQLGISGRYLRRIVAAQIGMSPKAVLRILRFRTSLFARRDYPRANWSEIAQRAGYYDQSHLIDEYQRFLGASPERFFNS